MAPTANPLDQSRTEKTLACKRRACRGARGLFGEPAVQDRPTTRGVLVNVLFTVHHRPVGSSIISLTANPRRRRFKGAEPYLAREFRYRRMIRDRCCVADRTDVSLAPVIFGRDVSPGSADQPGPSAARVSLHLEERSVPRGNRPGTKVRYETDLDDVLLRNGRRVQAESTRPWYVSFSPATLSLLHAAGSVSPARFSRRGSPLG